MGKDTLGEIKMSWKNILKEDRTYNNEFDAIEAAQKLANETGRKQNVMAVSGNLYHFEGEDEWDYDTTYEITEEDVFDGPNNYLVKTLEPQITKSEEIIKVLFQGTNKEWIADSLEKMDETILQFRGILKTNELNDSNAGELISGMLRLNKIRDCLYYLSINPKLDLEE